MTIGYPDWGRQSAQAGDIIIDVSKVITVVDTLAPVYVGDYQYVNVYVNNAAVGSDDYTIQLNWYADAMLATLMGFAWLRSKPDYPITAQFPAVSPWLQVKIAPYAGTATAALTMIVARRNGYSLALPSTDPAGLLVFGSDSIPAAGNVTYYAAVITPGEAVWQVGNTGTEAWNALLEWWDYTNQTWEPFGIMASGGTQKSMSAVVKLPAAPVRYVVTNQGTSSHTFTSSLVV